MRNGDFMASLEGFLSHYLPSDRGLSHNTIRSYRQTMRLFVTYMRDGRKTKPQSIRLGSVSHEDVSGFLSWLESSRGCSASTRNQRLAALSSFSEYAAREEADGIRFASEVRRVPQKKSAARKMSFFTVDEVRALIKAPRADTITGRRDRAILVFMYATGSRAQEVCDAKVGDIVFRDDGRATVTIIGKGGKARRVVIPKTASSEILAYEKAFWLQNDGERWLFGSQDHPKMSISCIEEMFKRHIASAMRANPAMFKGHYTPHSMRHTTATHMLQAGVPLIVIKNFLGHSSLNTTQIYAEVTQETVDKYVLEWKEMAESCKAQGKDKPSPIPSFLKDK